MCFFQSNILSYLNIFELSIDCNENLFDLKTIIIKHICTRSSEGHFDFGLHRIVFYAREEKKIGMVVRFDASKLRLGVGRAHQKCEIASE